METLGKIQEILRDIFDDESLMITRKTTSNDIEDWDSLAQINIIVACENAFGVKFEMADIPAIKSIGHLADMIERKLG